MMNLWELILKIFFNSPEMNRSILFSLYLLRMTKKMDYFLRNFVRRERMIPWFKINPIPCVHHDHETSMRSLVHTTGQLLWTDVGLSTTRQEGAATQTICATVRSCEHRNSWQVPFFVVFAFAFDRYAKSFTFSRNACSSG